MPDLADVLKSALSLPLAGQLLASLDELDEEEAELLWAQEAHRRREEYLAGRVATSDAQAVAEKASRLFR
ncbi:MAG TPA: addiction module protein [Terriglobia bacterium]|nr:addiction module protein [Terriglobia bacterium]